MRDNDLGDFARTCAQSSAAGPGSQPESSPQGAERVNPGRPTPEVGATPGSGDGLPQQAPQRAAPCGADPAPREEAARAHPTHEMTEKGCLGCGAEPGAVGARFRCANARCAECGDLVGCCRCPLCDGGSALDKCVEPAARIVSVRGGMYHGRQRLCAHHAREVEQDAPWHDGTVESSALRSSASEPDALTRGLAVLRGALYGSKARRRDYVGLIDNESAGALHDHIAALHAAAPAPAAPGGAEDRERSWLYVPHGAHAMLCDTNYHRDGRARGPCSCYLAAAPAPQVAAGGAADAAGGDRAAEVEALVDDLIEAAQQRTFDLANANTPNATRNASERGMQDARTALLAAFSAQADRVAALEQELRFYKEREQHFAAALGVADGGTYRADWDGALARLIRERDAARAAAERSAEDAARLDWLADAFDGRDLVLQHDEPDHSDHVRERDVVVYDEHGHHPWPLSVLLVKDAYGEDDRRNESLRAAIDAARAATPPTASEVR